MTDTVENLVCDLVEWVGRKERTYQEAMGAWRTSCPRLPVWEDATERGLVETLPSNGRLVVRATPAGLAFLKGKRPHVCEDPQPRSPSSERQPREGLAAGRSTDEGQCRGLTLCNIQPVDGRRRLGTLASETSNRGVAAESAEMAAESAAPRAGRVP